MAKYRLASARKAAPAILVAIALAGCAKPPAPLVFAAPPPPPVGHPYQVMVDVPAPTTRHVRITPEQQQQVQQAFNVIALKSALMVAALSCNQQDQYDQFMTSFQPHVLAEQHVMDAYFRRIGGYYGQSREDDFVTLLANNQSVGGISQGALFCVNNSAEYKAVLALRSSSDLDNFVTDLAPDATVVSAAGPTVTPLAPNSDVHIAVLQSTHRVHLVHARGTRSENVVQARMARHVTASNTVKTVEVSDPVSASRKLNVAAVVP